MLAETGPQRDEGENLNRALFDESRDQLAHFRELNGQRAVKGREHQTSLLRQRDEIAIVPLPVACHRRRGHRPGAIQVGRHELHSAPMRQQTGQPQGFGWRMQRRQNLTLDAAGPAKNLQKRKLGRRRDGKSFLTTDEHR